MAIYSPMDGEQFWSTPICSESLVPLPQSWHSTQYPAKSFSTKSSSSKLPAVKRTRRGFGKRKANTNRNKSNNNKTKLSLLGSNANGIKSKMSSLKDNINNFRPTIITLQETKSRQKGLVKLQGYQIYENIRTCNLGGGLLTAIDEKLDSAVITEDENFDILTVQFQVDHKEVRIINAYGPQEDCNQEYTLSFWQRIEEEVLSARDNDCLVLIQLDANAKLGKGIIQNDPNDISNNGCILLDLVKRLNLTVANSLDRCSGVITRERVTTDGIERSVLDYILVCDRMRDSLESMMIDDKRNFTLTRFLRKKVIRSDHNILYSTFSIKFNNRKPTIRKEIFKLREKEGQQKFLKLTSTDNEFSGIFSSNLSFPHQASLLFKKIKDTMQRSFTKVRVMKGGRIAPRMKDQEEIFLAKRRQLMMFLQSCSCSEKRSEVEADLERIEEYLAKISGEKNTTIVKEHIGSVEVSDGRFNNHMFWKLKSKLCPAVGDSPMAKRDKNGNIITAPESLKLLYADTYSERLSNRIMKSQLMDVFHLKEELWTSRIKELHLKKTEAWTINQLRDVLKKLKVNKSTDPNMMINELFKEGCIGQDLENALLLLCNGIKETFHIPTFISKQNICTIYKNKGSRLDMKNDRGIFILTTLRRIIDNLLYQDKFNFLDANMSDSNVGSRKGRQVKNHLFIVHGVINSVINGKEECVDIHFYDLQQAFDALWLADCMIDIFDTIPSDKRDEKLALLYKLGEENHVAVKTPYGLTKRMKIPQIVQQGGTWGPVMCSNSIDCLGKKLWRRGDHCYLYKNVVNILPLAMMDDISAISKCGYDSLIMNSYINTQIELKKLRFHVPDSNGKTKCHKLHVGCKSGHCPLLKVHGTVMQEVEEDEYLGDVICHDGNNKKNIQKRVGKGMGRIVRRPD